MRTDQLGSRGGDFSLNKPVPLGLRECTFETEDCVSLTGAETLKTSCWTRVDHSGAEQNKAGRAEGTGGNKRGTEWSRAI